MEVTAQGDTSERREEKAREFTSNAVGLSGVLSGQPRCQTLRYEGGGGGAITSISHPRF